MTMTFGSLFAGIGGFDLGLERAGMECRWQVEIDDYCQRVLAKHWPNVARYGDVKEVGRHNLEPVRLICGGPPCQPISQAAAGKQRSGEDDRWLWPETFRVIRELRPDWILFENPLGLSRMGLLVSVVSELACIGYDMCPPLEIPACAVGHDHRRSRYWILGYTNGNGEPGQPLNAETSRLSRNSRRARRMGAANGVPRRMDRLRALGNAVVPQVVEIIGRAIIQAEEEHSRQEDSGQVAREGMDPKSRADRFGQQGG